MKPSSCIKKTIIVLMSMFLVAFTEFYTNVTYALDDNIDLYGFEETYTIQADKGLINGYGYVTCKVGITYNSVGNTYKVAWVQCVPHLSSSYPFLKCGGVAVDPKVGNIITGNYVTVSFNVGEGTTANVVRYSVNIYL